MRPLPQARAGTWNAVGLSGPQVAFEEIIWVPGDIAMPVFRSTAERSRASHPRRFQKLPLPSGSRARSSRRSNNRKAQVASFPGDKYFRQIFIDSKVLTRKLTDLHAVPVPLYLQDTFSVIRKGRNKIEITCTPANLREKPLHHALDSARTQNGKNERTNRIIHARIVGTNRIAKAQPPENTDRRQNSARVRIPEANPQIPHAHPDARRKNERTNPITRNELSEHNQSPRKIAQVPNPGAPASDYSAHSKTPAHPGNPGKPTQTAHKRSCQSPAAYPSETHRYP